MGCKTDNIDGLYRREVGENGGSVIDVWAPVVSPSSLKGFLNSVIVRLML